MGVLKERWESKGGEFGMDLKLRERESWRSQSSSVVIDDVTGRNCHCCSLSLCPLPLLSSVWEKRLINNTFNKKTKQKGDIPLRWVRCH